MSIFNDFRALSLKLNGLVSQNENLSDLDLGESVDLAVRLSNFASGGDILQDIQNLDSFRETVLRLNAISFRAGIIKDIVKNFKEEPIIKPKRNSLASDNFVVYLDRTMESPFFQMKNKSPNTDKFLATRAGRLQDIMKIRLVDVAQEVPEILLLVNPSNLSYTQEKVYNNYYTRRGPYTEWNGNAPATLSFQGKSGGFYGFIGSTQEQGYNLRDFMRTVPFKNIMSIVSFYKNNGVVKGSSKAVTKKVSGHSIKDNQEYTVHNDVVDMGLVEIIYKHTIYRGSFTSMSLSFSDGNPNYLNYSFNFTAFQEFSSLKVLRS